MARLIPASERISRSRALINKAREFAVPAENGRYDLSYVAQIKALLQEARDLVKFIPYTPSASAQMKADVLKIFQDAEQAEKELLHKP